MTRHGGMSSNKAEEIFSCGGDGAEVDQEELLQSAKKRSREDVDDEVGGWRDVDDELDGWRDDLDKSF